MCTGVEIGAAITGLVEALSTASEVAAGVSLGLTGAEIIADCAGDPELGDIFGAIGEVFGIAAGVSAGVSATAEGLADVFALSTINTTGSGLVDVSRAGLADIGAFHLVSGIGSLALTFSGNEQAAGIFDLGAGFAGNMIALGSEGPGIFTNVGYDVSVGSQVAELDLLGHGDTVAARDLGFATGVGGLTSGAIDSAMSQSSATAELYGSPAAAPGAGTTGVGSIRSGAGGRASGGGSDAASAAAVAPPDPENTYDDTADTRDDGRWAPRSDEGFVSDDRSAPKGSALLRFDRSPAVSFADPTATPIYVPDDSLIGDEVVVTAPPPIDLSPDPTGVGQIGTLYNGNVISGIPAGAALQRTDENNWVVAGPGDGYYSVTSVPDASSKYGWSWETAYTPASGSVLPATAGNVQMEADDSDLPGVPTAYHDAAGNRWVWSDPDQAFLQTEHAPPPGLPPGPTASSPTRQGRQATRDWDRRLHVCEQNPGECADKWPDVYSAWLSAHEEAERESRRRRADLDGLTVRDEMFGEKAVVLGNIAAIVSGEVSAGAAEAADPAIASEVLGEATPNKLTPNELAQAADSVELRGGHFVGAPAESFPGIDGWLETPDGYATAVSMKEVSGGLSAVLKNASYAETQAFSAGASNVELYIKAPNVTSEALLDFASKGPLSAIPTQGTIRVIYVATGDGWVVLGGP
jgi:hypothetical protein